MEISCMGVRIWSVFMPLFPLVVITLASSYPREIEVDRLSLLAFKSEIVSDPLGILSSWNDTSDLCGEWRGITCGRRHQRVTVLNLQSSQLEGTISSHIGNLSFLRILYLQSNNFTATIPQEIGRLSRLRRLHLGDNSFQGDIPINISRCSNLQYLALANNTFSGKLPMELGSLLKLQFLSLRRNKLIGEIPPSFGNLSSLQSLYMEENNLQGSLMSSLGKLKSLRVLALGTNNLSGTIPPSIYNLSSIQNISVIGNSLHGTLPSGLGYGIFPNLQVFQFQMNNFSGTIPSTISNASHLLQFGISGNNFTGEVPSLARVSSLVRLEIDDNILGNEGGDLNFLSSLINCTSLQLLDISENKFQGVLPESVSNLSTKLTVMRLGRNQLHGRIPIGIGNLLKLGQLSIEENQLRGTIPTSVCNISKLYTLNLSENQLSGAIPSCLGNLTWLGILDLKSNNLQGGIPPSLGQCKHLLALVLAQNNLTGSIPQEVISLPSLSLVLDLSSNQFSGYIPTGVRFLINLGYLNLSANRLSGEIPESLGECLSLEILHLSRNFLDGAIPESLSSLRGIQDLDLSRNKLVGAIPNYLQRFPFLLNLNLSFNDFKGEVPKEGVFSNTSAVSLMGNIGLCGGVTGLSLPKCITPNRPRHLPTALFATALVYTVAVIIISSGFIGVVWLVSLAFKFVLLYISRKSGVKSASEPVLDVSLLKLSYGNLLKATDGFSSRHLIGSGSSGSVYWGVLDQPEERIVAVKVLNLQSSRASSSFISECEVLKNIRHRNLVRLVTACSSIDFQGNDFKALVFEFMLDGNLDEWLHYSPQRVVGHPNVQLHLNLFQRVNIAIDIASALDYLHNRLHVPIVHCDLKPSNVLLEKDMTACVCDFGLATFLPDASCSVPSVQHLSNSIRGTIGYIAPEYGMGSVVSTYGDVYSYGILLLEMLTGKRPTDDMFKDDKNLHNFVLIAFPERVKEICDPVLLQEKESCTSTNPASNRNNVQSDETQRVEECLISLARIGVACSLSMPKARMEIAKVVAELRVIRDKLTGTWIPKDQQGIFDRSLISQPPSPSISTMIQLNEEISQVQSMESDPIPPLLPKGSLQYLAHQFRKLHLKRQFQDVIDENLQSVKRMRAEVLGTQISTDHAIDLNVASPSNKGKSKANPPAGRGRGRGRGRRSRPRKIPLHVIIGESSGFMPPLATPPTNVTENLPLDMVRPATSISTATSDLMSPTVDVGEVSVPPSVNGDGSWPAAPTTP